MPSVNNTFYLAVCSVQLSGKCNSKQKWFSIVIALCPCCQIDLCMPTTLTQSEFGL